MSFADESKHRLELLKMARELANEEYINKRAEDHNDWLARVDVAWRTRGVRLPYPPFVPYPTEAEIVARAITLYGFMKLPTQVSTPAPPEVEPVVVSEPVVTDSIPVPVPVIVPVPELIPEPEPTAVVSTWHSYVNPFIKISDIVVPPASPVPIPEPIPEPILYTPPGSIPEIVPEIVQEIVPEPILEVVPEVPAVIDDTVQDFSPKPLFAETPNTTPVVKKSLLTSWFQKN